MGTNWTVTTGTKNGFVFDGSFNESGNYIATNNQSPAINTIYTTSVLSANFWYHYAIVCDLPRTGGTGTLSFYFNGAKQITISYSNYIYGFNSFLYFQPDRYYLYKLNIYNYALSQSQIQAIYLDR